MIRPPLDNQYFLFILRILLGGIFIFSAILKIPNQTEFIQIVNSYGVLPYSLAVPYGLLLPWIELIIGCLLITGLFTRLASGISFAIIISFIIANVFAMYGYSEGTGDLCGCFGDAMPLNHQQALLFDILMLCMSIPLILWQSHLFSLRLTADTRLVTILSHIMLIIIMLSLMVPQVVIQASNNSEISNQQIQTDIPSIDNLDSATPVLLFFHADWCRYCQEQKPIIDELEAEYGDRISFIRVDSTNSPQVMEEWDIKTIPTTVLGYGIATEYEYQRLEGFTEKRVLTESLDAMLAENYRSPAIVAAAVEGYGTLGADAITPDTLPDVQVQELTVNTEIDVALINGQPVFLFFSAEWCGYCQEQHPVIDELGEEYGENITFIRALNEEYPF